jgi:acylpyruvate hydrolase
MYDDRDNMFLIFQMTERNKQAEAKSKGHPWSIAKGYDTFAPLGDEFFPADQIKDPHNLELYLKVNGEERQRDSTTNMIHSIPRAIAFISKYETNMIMINVLQDYDIRRSRYDSNGNTCWSWSRKAW